MTCPLIGRIAVTFDARLADLLAGPAVRVAGYSGHDVILVNPAYSLWDQIAAVSECVRAAERQQLVYGVTCACEPLESALSA